MSDLARLKLADIGLPAGKTFDIFGQSRVDTENFLCAYPSPERNPATNTATWLAFEKFHWHTPPTDKRGRKIKPIEHVEEALVLHKDPGLA